MNLAPKERLIVALDFPSAEEAMGFVDRMGDTVTFYKVGLELFSAAGPEIVRRLKAAGKSVFLDMKFHDIPNTVAGAAASAVGIGAPCAHSPVAVSKTSTSAFSPRFHPPMT